MKIDFNNVSKIFEPDITALKDINININNGEFVYIIGATGSGKSTFLHLITRELLPTRGTVSVNNLDLRKMRKTDVPYYRRTIGLVSQDFKLIQRFNVYENVAFVMETMGLPEKAIAQRANEVINKVGLWNRRFMLPEQLSGGEQQRVAIARALANAPDIFIADEPTGNLDLKTAVGVMKILLDINSAGVTVIMSTHNQYLVDVYPKRVVELSAGALIRDEQGGKYYSKTEEPWPSDVSE